MKIGPADGGPASRPRMVSRRGVNDWGPADSGTPGPFLPAGTSRMMIPGATWLPNLTSQGACGVAAAIADPFMVVTVADRSDAWPVSR